MSLVKTVNKRFTFVLHRNGFTESVIVNEESKWLAQAKMREMYPGAKFTMVAK